jgi:flagellar biosynthesis chaperone FliJ
MGPFVFSLERVLSWRSSILTREEAKLELLRGELNALERTQLELRRQRLATRDQVHGRESVAGGDLLLLEAYGRRLDRQELENAASIARCCQAADTQEAVVIEARRRVRLVEKLKQRRREEWRLATDREIETEAGEFAVTQWRRLHAKVI